MLWKEKKCGLSHLPMKCRVGVCIHHKNGKYVASHISTNLKITLLSSCVCTYAGTNRAGIQKTLWHCVTVRTREGGPMLGLLIVFLYMWSHHILSSCNSPYLSRPGRKRMGHAKKVSCLWWIFIWCHPHFLPLSQFHTLVLQRKHLESRILWVSVGWICDSPVPEEVIVR